MAHCNLQQRISHGKWLPATCRNVFATADGTLQLAATYLPRLMTRCRLLLPKSPDKTMADFRRDAMRHLPHTPGGVGAGAGLATSPARLAVAFL
jgi:hypothetical protein